MPPFGWSNARVDAAAPLLDVRDLHVVYRTARARVHAVRGISLAIPPAGIFGLVGESGSGKSSVALAIMAALRPPAVVTGEVRYRGQNLLEQSEPTLRTLWGRRLAMVFQNPGRTLNPVLRCGEQVIEVLRAHERLGRTAALAKTLDLFRAVRLPDPAGVTRRYPHQLSGGQQQRVSIAIALACDPDLLIMDEPTTGLDVTTEARILDLVQSLRDRTRAAILYVSHNLAVIAGLCDAVGVMYAGEIVESGTVRDVFARPAHPYTLALLRCLPRADVPPQQRVLPAIEGALPDPTAPIAHCQFATRCPMAEERCHREIPPLAQARLGQFARCFFWQRVPAPETPAGGVGTTASPCRSGLPLLEARSLTHVYGDQGGVWQRWLGARSVRALDGVGLEVGTGEAVAVIGESGSGKTTLGRCLVGLLQPTSGNIRLQSRPLPSRPVGWTRAVRRHIQMVFQNPDLTLNPRRTVLDAVARPLALFGLASQDDRRKRAVELLRGVKLGPRYLYLLPHQLSGGERQRVAIARAFASGPDIVVCDEPTSALDVSVQAAILNLLVRLQEERGVSYVFISHDLSVVRHLADRVIVIYHGTAVEEGRTEDVFTPPHHPYTEALLSAVPSIAARDRKVGPASVPPSDGEHRPTGCPFHPRCPRKIGAICEEERPPLVADDRGHKIACHISLQDLRRTQR
jgi:peptide/nickel transport system ATP-binding protein